MKNVHCCIVACHRWQCHSYRKVRTDDATDPISSLTVTFCECIALLWFTCELASSWDLHNCLLMNLLYKKWAQLLDVSKLKALSMAMFLQFQCQLHVMSCDVCGAKLTASGSLDVRMLADCSMNLSPTVNTHFENIVLSFARVARLCKLSWWFFISTG